MSTTTIFISMLYVLDSVISWIPLQNPFHHLLLPLEDLLRKLRLFHTQSCLTISYLKVKPYSRFEYLNRVLCRWVFLWVKSRNLFLPPSEWERGDIFEAFSAPFRGGIFDFIAQVFNYLNFYGSVTGHLQSGWIMSCLTEGVGHGHLYRIRCPRRR